MLFPCMLAGEAVRLCGEDGTWADPDVTACERTDFIEIEAMVSSDYILHLMNHGSSSKETP